MLRGSLTHDVAMEKTEAHRGRDLWVANISHVISRRRNQMRRRVSPDAPAHIICIRPKKMH